MKSIDIAVNLLDKSIKLGQDNPAYYMNFIKLHKLMYLGQCYLNFTYGINLFDEKITANDDGPYVDGLNAVPAKCSFDEIKNIDNLKQYIGYSFPLSLLRDETCNLILDLFGKYNTSEIVKITKSTFAYQYCYSENHKNIINGYSLTKTGEEVFGNTNKQNEENSPKIVRKLTPKKDK